MCCLVLWSNFAVAYHPIRFVIFFSAAILSRPYLWNRYSQRLQIECAAWSCSLILHCCLPSNSLHYFLSISFFPPQFCHGPYLWNRYSQRPQIECAAWSCGLILHCCLPSNSLRYFILFFFLPRFCPGHISGTVTRRGSKLSVLLGPAVKFCTVAYHPIRFVIYLFFLFSFFPPRFCPGHISGTVNRRDSKFSALLGPAV